MKDRYTLFVSEDGGENYRAFLARNERKPLIDLAANLNERNEAISYIYNNRTGEVEWRSEEELVN